MLTLQRVQIRDRGVDRYRKKIDDVSGRGIKSIERHFKEILWGFPRSHWRAGTHKEKGGTLRHNWGLGCERKTNPHSRTFLSSLGQSG